MCSMTKELNLSHPHHCSAYNFVSFKPLLRASQVIVFQKIT